MIAEIEEVVVELQIEPAVIEVAAGGTVLMPPPVTAIAKYPVGGGRIIGLDGGYAIDQNIAGFSMNAADTGGVIQLVEHGWFEQDYWSWDTSKPIYLGSDGLPTQVPPTTGLMLIVARPATPTKIYINKEVAVWLTSS